MLKVVWAALGRARRVSGRTTERGRGSLATIAALLLVMGGGVAPAAAQTYWIRYLDTRHLGYNSRAIGINAAGQAFGVATGDGPYQGFFYDGSAVRAIGAWTVPTAMNALGQVIGKRHTPLPDGTNPFHPFIYDAAGLRDLTQQMAVESGKSVAALGINRAGQIVGGVDDRFNSSRPFLFSGGAMIDLGTLGGATGRAYAINDAGQIVGMAATQTGSSQSHAFLLTPKDRDGDGQPDTWFESDPANPLRNVLMKDLGTFGGSSSNAMALDAAGQAAGGADSPTTGFAFFHDGTTLINLGLLANGPDSVAYGTNSRGQVVGTAHVTDMQPHAFLWENGVLSDLNDRIPAGSGWTLTEAYGINDHGQIACDAIHVDGGEHGGVPKRYAVLLTPDSFAPPPPPIAPGHLVTSVPTSTGITLTWSDNSTVPGTLKDSSAVAGFEIEYRGSGDDSFRRAPSVGAGTTSTALTGLTPDQAYVYRVRAVNAAGGGSAWSAEVTGRTLPPPLAKLLLSPSPARGAVEVVGTVTLGTPAPPEGALVTLSGDHPAVTLPGTVSVVPGQLRAVFVAQTTAVGAATPVTLTASYAGVTVTAALTVLPPSESPSGPLYWIRDLGSPDDRYSRAQGINAAGHVAGVRGVGDSGHAAFLFDGQERRDLEGLVGNPADINAAGQIVGTLTGNETHAFLYDAAGVHDLGTLPGGKYSNAAAINGSGQVAGNSYVRDGQTRHAILLSNGVMEDLGTLGGNESYALDLNDAGQVVGVARNRAGHDHAFLYGGLGLRDLGTLGGDVSAAQGINGAGQVVGVSALPGNTGRRGFLYDETGMRALSTLRGGDNPCAINASAQIVGFSSVAVPEGTHVRVEERAMLWDERGVWELNDLVPAGNGWVLKQAVAINDRGQIACNGISTSDGRERALLLTPLSVSLPPVPAAPSDLGLNSYSTSVIELLWQDNSDNETGFEVEWKAGDGPFTRLLTLPASPAPGGVVRSGNLTIPTTDPNVVQTFRVRAINAGGGSAYSNEFRGTAAEILRVTSVLSLRLDPETVTGGVPALATLRLNGVAPVGGIPITLVTDDPTAVVLPANFRAPAGATEPTFTVETRPVSSPTTVAITASYAGTVAAAILTLRPPAPPAAPADLVVKNPTLTQLTLAWTDHSTNESGFEIERRGGEGSFSRIATVGANVTSLTNSGLAPGTRYTYRVRAVNAGGVSAYSNEAGGSTLSPTLVAFVLSPTLVQGGLPVAGKIVIDRPAPPGGVVCALSSDSPSEVSLPAAVTVPAGATEVAFSVTTAEVPTRRPVAITATYGGAVRNGTLTLLPLPAAPPSRYWITDLGLPPGGGNSAAVGINAAGQVVGYANGPTRDGGFWFDGTQIRTLGHGTQAMGINDAGQIVGHLLADGRTRAFVHDSTGLHELGTLPGNTDSSGIAINAAGQVVGSSGHAYLYHSGVMQDLGKLGGTSSWARAINDAGQVVGATEVPANARTGYTHAFLYDAGGMRDLGTLGGEQSGASGINGAGHVVGDSTLWGGNGMQAFFHDGEAMYNLGGLQPTPDAYSVAYGLNAHDQVVGMSDAALSGPGFHAFLWQNGRMHDLNDLLPPGSGWVIRRARAINEAGQIAAVGQRAGQALDSQESALLLTPYALAPPPLPEVPTGLEIHEPSTSQVTLTWQHTGATEAGFVVERKAADGAWQPIATLLPNTTRYEDAGLDAETTYHYRVHAVNDAGVSSDTAEVGAHVRPAALVALRLTPSTVRGGDPAEGTVTLDAPAPSEGALVTLASDDLAAAVPATVMVAAGATQATFAVATAAASERVTIRVTASYGGRTVPATLTVANPPAAPSDLVVSAPGIAAMALSWADRSAGETGFEIERRGGDAPWQKIATVGAGVSGYHDSGLWGGTEYRYRVRAVSADGASGYSNEAAGRTLPVTLLALVLDPAQVAGGDAATATVTLDGPAPTGGAVISVGNDHPETATAPENVTVPEGATSATFAVGTEPVATALPVRLEVRYGIRYGTAGPVATLTVLPPDPPAAPTILVVSDVTATELALTWIDNSAGETGFVIERKRGTGEWTPLTTTAANATSFRDSGLASGTHYGYRIRAVNLGGGSAWSNEAGGTTLSAGTPGVGISFSALSLPKSLAFGEQILDTTGGARTITLTNTGTAPLTVTSVTLKGPQATEFALVADSGETTVAPGGTRTLTLRFTPGEVGGRTATLVIADNAPGSPHSVELGGVGVVTFAAPVAVRGIAVFRPGTREWFFRGEDGPAPVVPFGGPGDVPVAADYLGWGKPQVAVFRPETREWFIRALDGSAIRLAFGGPADVPVPGDYLGLGRAQIAVYRTTTREWFLRRDDGSAERLPFGGPGDVPVPGDYFGLGRASLAVYRPGTGEWFLRRDDGQTVPIPWGTLGDVPVAGDYLGLHRAQVAVFRPSTREWFVRQDDGAAVTVQFGGPGDLPVPGDYFGAGRLSLGVYRPLEGTWFLRTDLGTTVTVPWGAPEDWPLVLKSSPR